MKIIPRGGKQSSILPSKKMMLAHANNHIARLESENKWLQERLAYTMVAVNALGRKMGLPAEEAKKVVDEFIKAEEIRLGEQAEVAKKQFVENMKNGIKPEFKIIDGDKKPDA